VRPRGCPAIGDGTQFVGDDLKITLPEDVLMAQFVWRVKLLRGLKQKFILDYDDRA